MKCPFCASTESKVVDKRETESDQVTRRRRECLSCKKRYTTYERLETIALTVVKKGNVRMQFDREKLLKGILKACEKRPIPRETIEKSVDEIEGELKTLDVSEVESKKIGKLVIKKLKKLDKIAYIRFASVYKDFKDIEEFEKELQKLKSKKLKQ